ncbi:MAG: lytic transglycosylase domain-containing protein [Gammaproteobacteria bacterium]
MERKTIIEVVVLVALIAGGIYLWLNQAEVSDLESELEGYEPPLAAEPYLALIKSSASSNDVPWPLMCEELATESGFDPNATNPSGAEGIAQFLPATAQSLGVNAMDPNSAIPGMAQYLASLYAQISAAGYGNSWALTLAAYDWGIGNVLNALSQGTPYDQWPQETQNYVYTITQNSGVDVATGEQFA